MANALIAGSAAQGRPKSRTKAKSKRAKRAWPPPVKPVRAFELVRDDGTVCMSVPLYGAVAKGRRFYVDLLDWERIKLFLGEEMCANEPKGDKGPAYVISKRAKAITAARSKGFVVILARWLTGATPGHVIAYRDGDSLNLIRSNLVIIDRREHWDAHRASRAPATVAPA